jgi:hypothetical protein
MTDEQQRREDYEFIASFKQTMVELVEGIDEPNVRFVLLNQFLLEAKGNPVDDVLIQTLCETLIEKEILGCLLVADKGSDGVIKINLN